MSNVFYHIYSATMDGCELTEEADAVARQTWLCMGCKSPKPRTGSVDVWIRSRPFKREPLTAVVHRGVPVASKKFLDSIGRDLVQRDLYLGKVYGPDGDELVEWVTFRGRHRVIIRGNSHVSHRRCPECGRDLYFAADKTYLYPRPEPNVDIFESDLNGLVLTEQVFDRSNMSRWPRIWVDKLTVADNPGDSLGELNPG